MGKCALFPMIDVDPGECELGNYIVVTPDMNLPELTELCRSPDSPEARRVRVIVVKRTSRNHRPWRDEARRPPNVN